jgi:serine/threonine protein kinase
MEMAGFPAALKSRLMEVSTGDAECNRFINNDKDLLSLVRKHCGVLSPRFCVRSSFCTIVKSVDGKFVFKIFVKRGAVLKVSAILANECKVLENIKSLRLRGCSVLVDKLANGLSCVLVQCDAGGDGFDMVATNNQSLPDPLWLDAVYQLGLSLSRAHALGITHHYIKLENICYHEGRKTWSYIDWGFGNIQAVKSLVSLNGKTPLTVPISGTLPYMHPLLITSRTAVRFLNIPSPRRLCDIYGFAVTMLALTGIWYESTCAKCITTIPSCATCDADPCDTKSIKLNLAYIRRIRKEGKRAPVEQEGPEKLVSAETPEEERINSACTQTLEKLTDIVLSAHPPWADRVVYKEGKGVFYVQFALDDDDTTLTPLALIPWTPASDIKTAGEMTLAWLDIVRGV